MFITSMSLHILKSELEFKQAFFGVFAENLSRQLQPVQTMVISCTVLINGCCKLLVMRDFFSWNISDEISG